MKNVLIGILLIISIGSLTFGYVQKSKLEESQSTCMGEKVVLEKLAQDQQVQAREFQKMAEIAHQETEVQRAICEEQLKALKQ